MLKRVTHLTCDHFPTHSQFLQQNIHVKVKISEEVNRALMSETEDYQVLGMYTKTYNKWFVSKETKVAWTVGMAKNKFCVYMQMIKFDHTVENFKDVKPKISLR